MAHDVLQGFWIHAGQRHFRAKCMAHGMGRHILGQDWTVLLGVLFPDTSEDGLVINRRSGIAGPGKEQEVAVAVDGYIALARPRQYTPERFKNIVPHPDFAGTAFQALFQEQKDCVESARETADIPYVDKKDATGKVLRHSTLAI